MQVQHQHISRVIASFPNYHAIGATVYRSSTNRPIKTRLNKRTGYLQISLSLNRKRYTRNLQTIICESVNGPKPTPAHEACHRDGNRLNCEPENLYWGTKKQNGYDRAYVHFTTLRGTKNPGCVLRLEQVRVIAHLFNLLKGLRPSAAKVAHTFCVSDVTVLNIWNRKKWRIETIDILEHRSTLRKSSLTENEVADILRLTVKEAVRKYKLTAEWIRKIKNGIAKFARGTNLLVLAGVM